MKKTIALLFLVCTFLSCNLFKENEEQPQKNKNKDLVLGGDKDENGCLASAGYIWSKLNKECVRTFSGIPLHPIDKPEGDATLCAYILFNEEGNKAELFLPNADSSIILERSSNTNPWVLNEWELIPLNGYQLKKSGKLIFAGDGEIGNDILEDVEELPEE